MELIFLAIAIFLVVVMLIISVFTLFMTPARDKALQARLKAIQYQIEETTVDGEAALLRQKTLSQMPALDRFLSRIPIALKLSMYIQQAGMELHVAKLLALMFLIYVTVFLLGLVLRLPLALALVLALVCALVPFAVVTFKRRQRFSKFEEQFPDAIDLLARAVRAGHAFTTGLDLIGKEMPEPVASEFRMTFEQQNLGLPLREAFQNLLLRVPLSDVHVFVTALLIQRESGGNLAEILENLATIIRDRFKLMRQVKVYTAQGRITLVILTAIAPLLFLIIFVMNREYISLLFTDPLGRKMLIAAVVMQILGFLMIRKIIQPKA